MTTATQYAKACNKCGQPILMKQSGGKWAAFEPDGLNTHSCGHATQNTIPTTPPQTPPQSQPSGPDQLTQMLNSKDFEAKVRLVARDEILGILKKAMSF